MNARPPRRGLKLWGSSEPGAPWAGHNAPAAKAGSGPTPRLSGAGMTQRSRGPRRSGAGAWGAGAAAGAPSGGYREQAARSYHCPAPGPTPRLSGAGLGGATAVRGEAPAHAPPGDKAGERALGGPGDKAGLGGHPPAPALKGGSEPPPARQQAWGLAPPVLPRGPRSPPAIGSRQSGRPRRSGAGGAARAPAAKAGLGLSFALGGRSYNPSRFARPSGPARKGGPDREQGKAWYGPGARPGPQAGDPGEGTGPPRRAAI